MRMDDDVEFTVKNNNFNISTSSCSPTWINVGVVGGEKFQFVEIAVFLNQVSCLCELTNKVQLSRARIFPILSIWCVSLLLIALKLHSHQPSEFSQLEIIFNFHSMETQFFTLEIVRTVEWEEKTNFFPHCWVSSRWNPRKWKSGNLNF